MSARSALLFGVLVSCLACSSRDDAAGSGATAVAAAAAAPHVVDVAAREYALVVPDTVPAGWVTLRMANQGQGIHYGHIVQIDSGRTVQDLVNYYLHAIRTSGPRPTWVKRFGGPGGTAPGDSASVTQYLEPGQYVWICPVEDDEGHPHFAKGEVKQFVVAGAVADSAARPPAPAAKAEIRLLDYAFATDTMRAGRQVIRVSNAGAEPHDVGMVKLAPGETIDDLRRFLNPERARRPEERAPTAPPRSLESVAGGVAAMKPGMHAFFEGDLTPGEYVLFCMVTAPDGRSHIEHGMMRQVTVR